ncbi:hypothetical protein [Serratia rhizosphaerae]|uniref:DUF3592 domain-containing protein n=1 Tax=Serratia rhizosphaerae TaxID=2597702 RepID=A0ABX6GM39_9GAMM|nr:hypothetical protein [Serratia rhizosphaerae]QHA87322.1 hypothetical protein FO014_10395 [Serratia rhizosphaerae]
MSILYFIQHYPISILHISIVSLIIFFIVFFLVKGILSERGKGNVRRNGVSVIGDIKKYYESPGSSIDLINITLEFEFQTEEGICKIGRVNMVIRKSDVSDYQAGKKIPLRYSKNDVNTVVVDAPQPFLAR